MLPGTIRLCWVGSDMWVSCGFTNMHVHACTVSSRRYLFLVLHPLLPQPACWPQAWEPPRCNALWGFLSVRVACVCVATMIWSTCRLRAVRTAEASYWAGTFQMTSSNGDKADKSGRLWLLQERKRLLPSACVSPHKCTFSNISCAVTAEKRRQIQAWSRLAHL